MIWGYHGVPLWLGKPLNDFGKSLLCEDPTLWLGPLEPPHLGFPTHALRTFQALRRPASFSIKHLKRVDSWLVKFNQKRGITSIFLGRTTMHLTKMQQFTHCAQDIPIVCLKIGRKNSSYGSLKLGNCDWPVDGMGLSGCPPKKIDKLTHAWLLILLIYCLSKWYSLALSSHKLLVDINPVPWSGGSVSW